MLNVIILNFIIIVLCIICFYLLYHKYPQIDTFAGISNETLLKSNTCDPSTELKRILDARQLSYNKTDDDYFIPCTYDSCETDAKYFESSKSTKKIFLIDGCDVLASKINLWNAIVDEYKENATKYMPKTIIINGNNNFIQEFTDHYKNRQRPDQMYVLKNYNQRQLGIKITRNIDEILQVGNEGWILVQDYIYNPYTIDKRKINFRYYLLIICQNGKVSGYYHKNGFVYYTAKYYDENIKDPIYQEKHITTGYIDRIVYETNPLTLEDFHKYLEKNNTPSKIWDDSINNLMIKLMQALSKKICTNLKLQNNLKFQLFGCDVAPAKDLSCTLMEINKGPDLGCKDDRDCSVKNKVQDDIFSITEMNNIESTDFIPIIY